MEVTRYLVIRVRAEVPEGTSEDEIDACVNNVDYSVRAAEGDDFTVTDTEVVACCELDEISNVL
jgi:hypothetical protein